MAMNVLPTISIDGDTFDSIERDILVEGLHDWVYSTDIYTIYAGRYPVEEAAERIFRATEHLLARGYVEIGELVPGFRSWDLPTGDAMAKARRGYGLESDTQQEKDEDLMFFWLRLTDRGRKVAEQLPVVPWSER